MNNTLNNALKPCPFCGGEACLKTQAIASFAAAFVQCEKCNVKSGAFIDSKKDCTFLLDAIDAWNRRAGEEKNNG